LHRPGTQHGNADGLSRRPIEVSGDDHIDSARVAAISCGPGVQKDATFDSRKAAAFLYQCLPTIEEIGLGDAEVYCENAADFAHAVPESSEDSINASTGDAEVYCETTPVHADNPTVHTVKAITKEEGDMSGLAGGISSMRK